MEKCGSCVRNKQKPPRFIAFDLLERLTGILSSLKYLERDHEFLPQYKKDSDSAIIYLGYSLSYFVWKEW